MQVTLLGEQVISDPVGTVRMRSARTVALVALLVVHTGSPQTRHRIATLFWPDSSEEQALTNLRRELHHLRGILGDDPSLVVTPRDLCWRDSPTCRVDVRAFGTERAAALAATDPAEFLAHATAAVEHYRGEFLPGSYEDWALESRTVYEQQCVDLLDKIVEARWDACEVTDAVVAAKRRIQLRPLEEVGYRTLMGLQGDLGDRAGAVSTYHHCASVLERELGVEPDPLTRTTLNQLLARTGPEVELPAEEPPRTGRAGTQLVGREREFGVLHDLWQAATDGRPGLAVVRGDPGVGKSRLMTELAETARRAGTVVASAQCFGTSGRLALAPVGDWLRTPAIRSALSGLDALWRSEVDRLVPSTHLRGASDAGPLAMVDAWQRHRFYEGVTRALLSVGRPVLLTVDNLHWCDPETLAFITFCLGLTADAPLLVVATMRDDPGEHEPELAQWIVRMRATGLLTEVALRPFEVADTATLAETITGRPLGGGDADLLQATTGGFPLYIVEAARTGDGPVPVGDLSSVLTNRLDQVGTAARDVASLAAAVGRDFTLDLLSEAADLDADTIVRAVDELWRGRILHEVGDGYDFSHDLLRASAYNRISPPKRWLLHRRIAQGLELLHAGDPDAVSAQLAEQYARGGRGERAVGYYRRAATVAAGMFAHGEAIRLHEEALAIIRALPGGRERTSQELTLLEAMAAPLNAKFGYSSLRLRETLERSIALAESLGRSDSVLNGLVGLFSSQIVHGDTAAAHLTAGRALALVEPGSPLSGPAHFAFAGSSVMLGMPEQAVRYFALAAEFGGGTHPLSVGTRPDVHGQAWAAHAHWLLGHTETMLDCANRAVTLARTTGNNYCLTVGLAYLAVTHQLLGDTDELSRTVEELRALCERYSFAYYREWAMILGAWADKDDPASIERARAGIDQLTADGSLARMPYWLSLLAELLARHGRGEEAVATLDAAISGGHARDDVWWVPEAMRRRAAYDDEPHAVPRLRAAAKLAAAHGSVELLRRCTEDLGVRGVLLDS